MASKEISNYLSLDYSQTMFDVVKEGLSYLNEYTELRLYPEFTSIKDKNANELMKFVFLCYDVKSPLIGIKNYEKRKGIAAELAGVPKNKIKSLVDETDSQVTAMVTCYIAEVQGNRKFQLLVASEQMYSSTLKNLNEPIDTEDAEEFEKLTKMRFENIKKAKELVGEIEDLEKEIFPDYGSVRKILNDKIKSEFKSGPADSLYKVKAKRTPLNVEN